MADYLPIAVLFVIATLFVALSFFASGVLGPRRREFAAKTGPYECGIITDAEPAERFPVRFYLVAMIFIIFDIEIIFLYPWAVVSDRLGLFGLVEMLLFTVAVVIALAYLLSNGALNWAPVAKLRGLENSVVDRTASSTIRRVSKEQIGSAGEAA